MRDGHPVDFLAVMVEGPPEPSIAAAMRAVTADLAGRRTWTLGPPRLLDGPSPRIELAIYSARPPWGAELDPDVDRAHLDEVKELFRAFGPISADHRCSLEVELGGETIGFIESGVLDSMLADSLLAEWERHLDRPER